MTEEQFSLTIFLAECAAIAYATYLLTNYFVKERGVRNYFLLLIFIIVPVTAVISLLKMALPGSEKSINAWGLGAAFELPTVLFVTGITLTIMARQLKRKQRPIAARARGDEQPKHEKKPVDSVKRKRILIILGVIIGILVITNPSMKAFKDFKGSSSYEGLSRNLNFFLVSVYSDENDVKYFGVLGNFFEL